MANELPHLVWIDCEMTGLSLETDALVEIAVLVTDSELNIIGEGIDLVIHATEGQLAGMNDFVRNMHTTSGLINEIEGGKDRLDDAFQVKVRGTLSQQQGTLEVVRQNEWFPVPTGQHVAGLGIRNEMHLPIVQSQFPARPVRDISQQAESRRKISLVNRGSQ